MLTQKDLEKIRVCSPLLPPPGEEVVVQLLNEIDRLNEAINMERNTNNALRGRLNRIYGKNEKNNKENTNESHHDI